MAKKQKKYRVLFFQTSIIETTLDEVLWSMHPKAAKGSKVNVPPAPLSGRMYQLRDLKLDGGIWSGVFCHLRDDAPNKVTSSDQEKGLDLDPDDRLVEKSSFLFRPSDNVLVWQLNVLTSWPGKFADYVSTHINREVELVSIFDMQSLDRVLSGPIKEIDVRISAPPVIPKNAPDWSQKTFNILKSVNGQTMTMKIHTGTGALLMSTLKSVLPFMKSDQHTAKLKVTMADTDELIDVLANRISGWIDVPIVGHYPDPSVTIAALKGLLSSNAEKLAKSVSAMNGD